MIHYCTEHLLNQQFILHELLRSFRKSIKKVYKYVSKLYFLPLRNIFVTNKREYITDEINCPSCSDLAGMKKKIIILFLNCYMKEIISLLKPHRFFGMGKKAKVKCW